MNEQSGDRMIPDLSQLRLDALLRELLDRAAEVLESQDRIHRLLDAVVSVASDLSLPDVLRRIVQSSIDLVGARYAAMGVLAPEGTSLQEFIYIGIDDQQRDLIGDLPHGKGILGLLIKHPEPIRMPDLHEHRQSYGFPPNHPPMKSFLGVPVRVRGEVFGNLYLTEKKSGSEFTDEDQTVVVALAAAAGIAIENARLFEQTRQREAWSRASNELTGALLADQTAAGALRLVARRAAQVSGAPLVAVALPDELGEQLVFDVVDGATATELADHQVPMTGSVLGEVYRSAEPRVIDDGWGSSERSPLGWAGEAPVAFKQLGSTVLAPLAAGQQVLGVLVVTKAAGQIPFLEPDLRMVTTFASHAALAIEFARAQEDRQRLAVFEDRDRIARDLHDQVIQRLFAIGLGLQGLTRLVVKPEVGTRVAGFVEDLDQTIREIRRSIFSLQEAPGGPVSLRGELLRVIQEGAGALGFEPTVSMDGPLDSLVPDDIRPDVLATLRETLSNAARHAEASAVTIAITVDRDGTGLRLSVRDDGKGMPSQPERNSGLANIADRATHLHGTCAIDSAPHGGTTVTWSVPLPK
ncbi:GAF domain-containing sensor histidine kinase [Actinocrispum wychmicini]|uniref:Histidine kinase/DNA gyrase B/HSP90-like ATPase n=1 Tax=Actinocrispum wychmicini TaxID=1213861 RepID=A0A4R2JY01_9PSEU|nr:GAF domain-containing protein [Actinocrispum wychmicini]TCO62246.1 histidine kinase/DNA gyrase B/HSP90-like ATPase [Actinocrispum wychmicini]